MTCMCLQISYKYREKRINVVFDLNIYIISDCYNIMSSRVNVKHCIYQILY